MKELSLQEIKKIELNILKKFDEFCKENDIRYYLSHGTLLGALRYKGFIPWDDDVDLLIPREDYSRLISLFQDDDQYRLYCFEKNDEYKFPYAKLCDMTTLKIEEGYDNDLNLGLDLDLFPLDAWDDDIDKAKKEARALNKNMFYLSLSKLDKADSLNVIKRFIKSIIMVICKMYGYKYFIRKIQKISCSKKQTGSKYLGCKAWCVYGERGIIPAEVFADTIDVEFEGEMFTAPIGYDTYLTCLYGDYMPEPPKEKQKTHHVFKAYKL